MACVTNTVYLSNALLMVTKLNCQIHGLVLSEMFGKPEKTMIPLKSSCLVMCICRLIRTANLAQFTTMLKFCVRCHMMFRNSAIKMILSIIYAFEMSKFQKNTSSITQQLLTVEVFKTLPLSFIQTIQATKGNNYAWCKNTL